MFEWWGGGACWWPSWWIIQNPRHTQPPWLFSSFVSSGLPLQGPSFVFQKDNEPQTHTSRLCKSYLTKQESDGVLRRTSRPAQSHSRNPSEIAWDEMDHRVKEKQPKKCSEPLGNSFKTVGNPFQVTSSRSQLREPQECAKMSLKQKVLRN